MTRSKSDLAAPALANLVGDAVRLALGSGVLRLRRLELRLDLGLQHPISRRQEHGLQRFGRGTKPTLRIVHAQLGPQLLVEPPKMARLGSGAIDRLQGTAVRKLHGSALELRDQRVVVADGLEQSLTVPRLRVVRARLIFMAHALLLP